MYENEEDDALDLSEKLAIEECLGKLTPVERSCLIGLYYEEYTREEQAKRMHLTKEEFEALYRQALHHLRKLYFKTT